MKQFDSKNEIRMTNRAIACVAKETSRYAINGPLVVAAAGKGERPAYAVSTDGNCLSVVPGIATGAGSGGAVIAPASAFPKRAGKSAKDCVLTIDGADGVARIHSVEPGTPKKPGKPVTMPEGVPQEEGTFPPFVDVMPHAGSFATIALNPTLLANVAAAVGQGEHFEHSPPIVLYVPIGKERYRVRGGAGQDVTVHEPSVRPMIVTSTQTTGAAIALQMPIKAEDMPASLASGFQTVARAAELAKDPTSTKHAEPLKPEPIKGDEPTGPGAGDFEELRAELAKAKAEIERLTEHAGAMGRNIGAGDAEKRATEAEELVKALRADSEYAEKRIAELSAECERLGLELEAAQVAAEEMERIEADQAEAERDAEIAKARAMMKTSRVAVVDTVPASGWSARAGVTKKGREWVALCPTDRLDDADYAELLDRVKGIGGWWARAWNGEPGGFAVWPEKREALAELIGC